MHAPVYGEVTEPHEATGGYHGHAGDDVGARPRQRGAEVRAAFGGWVENIVRWSYPGNDKSTWAPWRTGNGMRVRNPDGEAQGYNHMMPLDSIRDGQWVDEGQLIGHLDDSGNQSAQHLHFECWHDGDDPTSDYPPSILYEKYDIDLKGPFTVTQFEEIMARMDAQDVALTNVKAVVDAIRTSVSGQHVDDFGNEDRTTMAGALERILTTTRHNGEAVAELDDVAEYVRTLMSEGGNDGA